MRLNKSVFSHLLFAGLVLFAAALPLSIFLMSISQFIIVGAWIFEGGIIQKVKVAFSRKAVLVLISGFLLHLTGLIYTTDFHYAVNDLRIKLPWLMLPIIFATLPQLTQQKFKWVVYVFLSATFISTGISLLIYAGIYRQPIHDIRDISIFISHIRLALMVCMAVFICAWLINGGTLLQKVMYSLLIAWFLFFLVILESITGLGIVAFVFFTALIYKIIKSPNLYYKIIGSTLAVVGLIWAFNYGVDIWHGVKTVRQDATNHLVETTAYGHPYTHDAQRSETENGYLVWININDQELDSAWNSRSKLKFNDQNLKGDALRSTLIRFLASKGERKDAEAVNRLTKTEISAIEKGYANVALLEKTSIRPRLQTLAWEIHQYLLYNNPSGHSVAMRLEFWRTAWLIICDHPLTGVGTGDVAAAFEQKYNEINSPLDATYRLRAHNQYLTVAIALGIPVMFWFIFSLLLPGFYERKYADFLFTSFLITSFLSMLTEDTLETQAGMSFFIYFFCLFLFLKPADKNQV
jgi:hypothetical protein